MRVWIEELSGEAKSAWAGLRSFWKEEVLSLLRTFGVFFALAAPIITVILILWYLDSTGWRSGSGFYTIGRAASACALAQLA